jgi:D-3-phosphoglycerate dehydrogenase / 2-oxoglutarate reductase
MTHRVLVSCIQMQRELPDYAAELAALDIEAIVPTVAQQLSEDELIDLCADINGVIAGDDYFTAKVFDNAPKLRIVSKWGIGTDAIDKEAAARHGVAVTNTPGVFGDEVADVAIGYVLMLARGLHLIDRDVRAGGWRKIEGETLAGKTLGIVGLGSIGRAAAARGAALGMTVLGTDPYPDAQRAAKEIGVRVLDLDGTFRDADYLVLCLPMAPENFHLVDARRLALMKPTARLVNVARGPLVDEAALVEALTAGRIAGAALDVFEVEPLPADSPLRSFESVILGSHNGSNTREGVRRTSRLAFDNLIAGLGLTPA